MRNGKDLTTYNLCLRHNTNKVLKVICFHDFRLPLHAVLGAFTPAVFGDCADLDIILILSMKHLVFYQSLVFVHFNTYQKIQIQEANFDVWSDNTQAMNVCVCKRLVRMRRNP